MQDDTREALAFVSRAAMRYVDELDRQQVRLPNADEAAWAMPAEFPEEGAGTIPALETLVRGGIDAAVRSSGPRFFHFVQGGGTPAALAADWLASTLDQNSFTWVASPLGTRLEKISIDWLNELFGLPPEWGGILTTATTTAHVTALAAARQWWAEQHGVDVDEQGLSGLPPVPIFSSGYLHTTARKALATLGIGRSRVRTFAADTTGRLDVDALSAALHGLRGAPAIVIANVGEVNTGDFDPIGTMADLAGEFGAWLHVDGAFGIFAALSPRTAQLVRGMERARSVVADGHKWLNFPYDCGFSFVAEPERWPRTFTVSATYIPDLSASHPDFGHLGPESSRRARALAVWATLRAYGRSGYREMVERHLDLAQRIARRVDAASDLERLAPVPLNIVCFRFHPPGVPEEELNALNERLGAAVLEDGRVYVGTTTYAGNVALRPAIANWRTGEEDVDLLVDVIRELGAKLAAAARP